MLVLNREEPFRQAVDEALSGKRSQQMLHLNGRYCKLLANPVLADGKPAGAVLVLLDVTRAGTAGRAAAGVHRQTSPTS